MSHSLTGSGGEYTNRSKQAGPPAGTHLSLKLNLAVLFQLQTIRPRWKQFVSPVRSSLRIHLRSHLCSHLCSHFLVFTRPTPQCHTPLRFHAGITALFVYMKAIMLQCNNLVEIFSYGEAFTRPLKGLLVCRRNQASLPKNYFHSTYFVPSLISSSMFLHKS